MEQKKTTQRRVFKGHENKKQGNAANPQIGDTKTEECLVLLFETSIDYAANYFPSID